MSKWTVSGYLPLAFVMTVDAESEAQAKRVAAETFPALIGYGTDGYLDNAVGVEDERVSLLSDACERPVVRAAEKG